VIESPSVIDLPPQTVAMIPITVAREQIKDVMGPGLQELVAALKAQGLVPVGVWFTHHLRRPTDSFDFEICIPVASTVIATGRVQPSQTPPMTAAKTVYRGPYEGLGDAWGAFITWVSANGHAAATDLYERYIAGPESSADPAKWQTELILPLRIP
jgi:effector-binding domain-containing protein